MPRGGGGGFTAPGQREQIIRGERTDPRAILGQAGVWGGLGSFIVLVVMGGILVNKLYRVRDVFFYVADNWRWLGLIVIAPIVIAAVLAMYALFIEIFDPNWPPPRDATPSTRPLMPHSKERMQPKAESRTVKVKDLIALLESGEEGGGFDDDNS